MRVKVNAETAREVLYAGGVVWHQDGVDDPPLGMPGWSIENERMYRQITPFSQHAIPSNETLDDVLTWTDCEIEVPEERLVRRKTAPVVETIKTKGRRRGL